MNILDSLQSDLLANTIAGLLSTDRQDNLDALETLDEETNLPITETILTIEQVVKLTVSTLKILQGIQTREPNLLATRAAAHYRKPLA